MLNTLTMPYTASYENFFLAKHTSLVQNEISEKKYKKGLNKNRKALHDLQEKLYAHNKYAVLLIFQAMDAAGKDSTIKHVMRGINPAGCQVFSFKRPSKNELDHDFLWRTAQSLPERGRIGVFNRSYYEEVLAVKVHPEFLSYQNIPDAHIGESIWQQRYDSIADHELHLARNGTLVLKFFLNVSREEQHRRFLSRLERPEKNWKFSAKDLDESELWNEYMHAYEQAITHTSKPWAPWFVIPADNKPAMRWIVSDIIRQQLERLDLRYPELDELTKNSLANCRKRLIV